MMEICDNMPVAVLPDGRRALIDTGCNAGDILSDRRSAPVPIGGKLIRPTVSSIDLDGIARRVGAVRLDMLIGASLLYEGFTVDLRNQIFDFETTDCSSDEEIAVVLPYIGPESSSFVSPVVEFEISGEKVEGIFDTGAPYSLWKLRAAEPNRPVESARTDFHVGQGGELFDFPVQMRAEHVRFGTTGFDLDIAYFPESWPPFFPDCVVGMDVLAALRVTRFVLDPELREIRFYRQQSILEKVDSLERISTVRTCEWRQRVSTIAP